MSIFNTDIIIRGKHAEIVKRLVEHKIFDNNLEVFLESSLLGIYFGKKADVDSNNEPEVNISRTTFQREPKLERILFTFLQHEKMFQTNDLTAKDVFLVDENTENIKDLINQLLGYTFFGIEKLDKIYSSLPKVPNGNSTTDLLAEIDMLNTEDLVKKAIQDKGIFYKIIDEEDVSSLLENLVDKK